MHIPLVVYECFSLAPHTLISIHNSLWDHQMACCYHGAGKVTNKNAFALQVHHRISTNIYKCGSARENQVYVWSKKFLDKKNKKVKYAFGINKSVHYSSAVALLHTNSFIRHFLPNTFKFENLKISQKPNFLLHSPICLHKDHKHITKRLSQSSIMMYNSFQL